MQLKALLIAALASSIVAAPVERVVNVVGAAQDVDTITKAFSAIESALTALDASVNSLSPTGDAKAAAAGVLEKSKAVESALKDGTTKVGATSAVSLIEAIQIQSASSKLTGLTSKVIDDLIAKKDVIAGAGQTKVTLDSLTSQKAASDAFIKAVTSKVPSGVQSIAAAASKSVGDALTKGINAFSGAAKRAAVSVFN
jgi:hypothetical protein